jgi:hypothetical protein
MFYLSKSDNLWTLGYKVRPGRRTLMIAGRVVGLCVAIFQAINFHVSYIAWSGVMLPVIPCLIVAGYWVVSDSATEVTFDMTEK